MICNLCGSSDNKIIYNYTRFEKNDILKCNSCGLVFLKITESGERIEESYVSKYRSRTDNPILTPEQLFNDPVVHQDSEKRINWLEKTCGSLKDKRIVEIGSASGHFLNTLHSHGANVTGIEYDIKSVEYSRSKGLDIYSNSFQIASFKDLDIVVMFHTLEHVLDPISLVNSIYHALKLEGGKFMGEVPNQDDWRISIFNCNAVKRFHYDPCHYYYFTPISLYTILQKTGFYLKNIDLSSVERYNSLLQLTRIINGYYNGNISNILKHDIFTAPSTATDIEFSQSKEVRFNEMFEAGVDSELKGNCLRWIATK